MTKAADKRSNFYTVPKMLSDTGT